MTNVQLQHAPVAGGLQFAFVQMPASAAEVAIEELDGLSVLELSDQQTLIVKQSQRSLKPLLHWQARQQQQVQQQGSAAAAGPAAAAQAALYVVCEDGSPQPLLGRVREVKRKWLVCEGPPSRTLWVGSVGGHATAATMQAQFSRQAPWRLAVLQTAAAPCPQLAVGLRRCLSNLNSGSVPHGLSALAASALLLLPAEPPACPPARLPARLPACHALPTQVWRRGAG